MTDPLCPICSVSGSPAFIAGGYHMYRCHACGSAFVHPMPDELMLTRFYNKFHQSATEGGWYDEADDRMQLDFPAKIRMVRQSVGTGRLRLLDVGCGKGYFLKACVEAGFDAIGVDVSSSGVAFAKNVFHLNAHCGGIRDLKKGLGTFDVITFWATIEHVPDPIQVLRDLHELLKPGGHLFCDTGIAGDWLDQLLPGLTQWYDPPQHLFVFSARGAIKALNDVGFSVEHLDKCFERSRSRRILRIIRNAILAVGFRATSLIGRMRSGSPFVFTRYPIGNLMSIVAIKR